MHGKNLSEFMQKETARDPELPKRLRRLNVYFNVAFRITNMRKRRGLTQTGLAKLLGTTQPNIARWETPGYSRYSLSRLIDIAEALNTTLEIRFVDRASFFDRVSWNDGEKMIDLIQDSYTNESTDKRETDTPIIEAPRNKFQQTIHLNKYRVEVVQNA